MSPNLPPILPTASHGMGSLHSASMSASQLGRAQDVSVSQLQQHKDRESAKVSMNQAISDKAKKDGTSASVSVFDGHMKATTSVSHANAYTIYDEGDGSLYDEGSDDRRWRHIREMMRKKKEEEANKGPASHVKTGAAYRETGRDTFHKKLGKFVKAHRMKFITAEDKAFFENMIRERAHAKKTGQSFGFTEKKNMRIQVDRAYREGKIGKLDRTFFKEQIDNL